MNTFDLNVKHGLAINNDTQSLFDIIGQTFLIAHLGRSPFLVELGITIMLEQALQEIKVLEPGTRSKSLCDEVAEYGIALIQPSPGSDTVRDIAKLGYTKEVDKV